MEHITTATITTDSSTGYFLHEVYTSLTENLPMQTLNTTLLSTYVNPQNIDRMVEMEMKRIQANCSRKEEQYVEQMLRQNPITIERRTLVNSDQLPQQQQQHHHQYLSDAAVAKDTNTVWPQGQQQLQQQRADACRRSRYNNKIKKAKSKFRHKYMSQKLLQSSQMFECIEDLIAQAENHLLAQGLTKDKLHELRHSYGVDKASNAVRKFDHVLNTDN